MAGQFRIEDQVVTGDALQRQHQGQGQVSVLPQAVITPTGWDYIRQHRLEVVRSTTAPQSLPEAEDADTAVAAQQSQPGRCDQPDKPFGCQTEEFGSGFAEPTSCHDCTINKLRLEGRQDVDCHGCNRHKALQQVAGVQADELVRHIADLVAQRLGSG
ncbi:MAG: hypothetical protein GKR89_24105 [Candidatus Latescibacteria bacterium]|nr:hypothetical protein [Candidatus Latescibacterota bacterium]